MKWHASINLPATPMPPPRPKRLKLGKVYKFLFIHLWSVTGLVAQTVKRLLTMQETWVQSLGREALLEKEMAAHSSTFAWKSHGQKSLVGYSPWGHNESDTTEWLHFIHFTSQCFSWSVAFVRKTEAWWCRSDRAGTSRLTSEFSLVFLPSPVLTFFL